MGGEYRLSTSQPSHEQLPKLGVVAIVTQRLTLMLFPSNTHAQTTTDYVHNTGSSQSHETARKRAGPLIDSET